MNDPPAPDLGALRARLDRRLENYREAGQNWGRLVSRPELEALLAAYDAEAARLAEAKTEIARLTAELAECWDQFEKEQEYG